MPKSNIKTPDRHLNDSNWMITFGDLLTLLLCFFCAILATNPNNFEHLAQSSLEKEPGTFIAQFGGREWLAVSGLAGEREVKEAVIGAIPKQGEAHPTQKSGEIADIYVEVCDRSVDKPESWSWHQSMELALKVKRQLIDELSVSSEQIFLRAVGNRCDELAPPVRAQDKEIGIGIRFQGRF